MDQTLADALDLPQNLNRLRALPEDGAMYFAYAPAEAILLLHHRTKLTKSKMLAALQDAHAEPEEGVGTVWCGTATWTDGHPVFRMDPKVSTGGPLQVKLFRTGLIQISRDLRGCIALRDPEIVRPSDKLMSTDDLKESGGKASWRARFGKASTYTKILGELEDLGKDRSNDKRREGLGALLGRIRHWFDRNDEDIGEGGDKRARAEALTDLLDQVVGELARTLQEGRMEPSEDERAIALTALEARAQRAVEDPDLDNLGGAARDLERWASLGVRPDPELTNGVALGLSQALLDNPGRATPRTVKATARLVRRVRLDLFDVPEGEARVALIDLQSQALAQAETAMQAVLLHAEDPDVQEAAAREAVKLERDLAAIRKERALQVAISADPDAIRFSGGDKSAGVSGSYFVSDGDRPRAAVFKPVSQEVVPDSEGWPSGVPARGEVLGARFGELLGKRLGIDFGIPPTDVGVLHAPRFQQYEPPEGEEPLGARDDVQLGVIQDFVGVSHGDINQYFIYHSEEFGIDLPVFPPDTPNETLDDALAHALEGDPSVDWESLDPEARKSLRERVYNKNNQQVRYPEDLDLDAFGRGLDQIAILDLFTLQTDRNPGNVLIDVREGEDGELHTRAIPIDQALSMPPLQSARLAFGGGSSVDRTNGFSAWIDGPGHDRPLDQGLVEGIQNLEIDAQIEDMRLESEQLDESTGGRLPALPSENLEIQRLSMRTVQEVLRRRPDLSRRQLANVIEDFDRVPWSPGKWSQKSPFGEALRRLYALKEALAEERAADEELEGHARGNRVAELVGKEDLLARADFEAEWVDGLLPSIGVWLDALPD